MSFNLKAIKFTKLTCLWTWTHTFMCILWPCSTQILSTQIGLESECIILLPCHKWDTQECCYLCRLLYACSCMGFVHIFSHGDCPCIPNSI